MPYIVDDPLPISLLAQSRRANVYMESVDGMG